ncbi:hypothetical protein N656DRAFT_796969 [Canariomyces notabilis]|uniref:Uncharacterized protein n=1 Tax=Canariomyces notabilis TaxID=2074819 RepID=A0AAN6TFX6_9PEZI|nr:hypothetical protein N656DRAFT_796969 [Canariomyces arenarius]
MKNTLGYALLTCAVYQVQGNVSKWSSDEPRWTPAHETVDSMLSLGSQSPVPTAPPEISTPRKLLLVPDPGTVTVNTNVCGYMDGKRESPLFCASTQLCAYNDVNSYFGCCDTVSKSHDLSSDCLVPTVCYDSAEKYRYTYPNGRTLWCGNSNYPRCYTHKYQDDGLIGYTFLGCAKADGTGKVWRTPTPSPTSTSSSSSSLSSSSSSTTTISTTVSSSSNSSNATPIAPHEPSSSSSSVPIGAIVGGVVGGLAAIALILWGIWALRRQNSRGPVFA